MSSEHSLKADGLLVLVTLLAAGGWFFSLYAMRGLPLLVFIGARFLMAGTVLGSCGYRPIARMGRRELGRAALTGIAMCLSITLWARALQLTDNLGVGAFICSLGNIVAPLIAWILFRIKVSRTTWGAVAIATIGMACLSLQGGVGFSPADFYFLASAVANSLYLNLNNRYALQISPLPLTAVQLTVVGILALSAIPFQPSAPTDLSAETIAWFLASVLIATSLRYFLLVKGQSTAPISHTAVIMNLEPVWTSLLAALCLRTTINGVQLVGCLLIFLALLFNNLPWGRILGRSGQSPRPV